MEKYRMLRLLAVLFCFTLLATACGDDGSGDGDATDDDNTAQDGSVLAAVMDRSAVNCGVNNTLPGFGVIDSDGNFSGFDVDMCRAIAAALLGDADAVNFTPLTAGERFTALQSGSIDVLIRNTTWTAARDGTEGATFLHTTFFDGQGIMVPVDSIVETIKDLDGATICLLSGTTTELNLSSRFGAEGISFIPLTFDSADSLSLAYQEAQCDAWTADASGLVAYNAELTEEQGLESRILDEIFSKEPLGPVVADGDSQWAQIVDWVVLALIQAEEFGLTSDNIGDYADVDPADVDPNVLRFVGAEDPQEGTIFDSGLGLPSDFAVNAVSAVGNYGELFEKHLAPLGISRGPNALWTDGGLLYAPPFR